MNPEPQSSRSVLLVRPAAFGFHSEAAKSNAFARARGDTGVAASALREFDGLAERLADAGVEVLVLEDFAEPPKPDAVFPNNWVSFHGDGSIVLYPMATAARRLERAPDRLTALLASAGFEVRRIVDPSGHELDGRYLEGTGSLVLDRVRRRAYANLSSRTDPSVVAEFDRELGYSTLLFDARDRAGRPIYHTNVMMSLGTDFALLCPEVVADEDRASLLSDLEAGGRTIVQVSFDQLSRFACNLIELKGRDEQPVIALSSAALASFTSDQRRTLERFGSLVDSPIPTIEAVGGGSVRCMIADVHLPRVTPNS